MRSRRRNLGLTGALAIVALGPFNCIGPLPGEVLVDLEGDVTGSIAFTSETKWTFMLQGTQSGIGAYTARGEVEFVPGATAGSLVGAGVAAFDTDQGDMLVGLVSWAADPATGETQISHVEFRWRDSVTFSDGSVARSTGRFATPEGRPPGARSNIASTHNKTADAIVRNIAG